MDNVLDCNFDRRFGVEIELNTSDGVVRELFEKDGDIALGSDFVANLISRTLKKKTQVQGWKWTNNNDFWIVKPDSSCGIEVCSPVLKGWLGLKELLQVVDAFSKSREITCDERCSFHVHLNISDMSMEQLATVFAYYIKCEHVIFDAFPHNRKNNKYSQLIGMTDLFSTSFDMDVDDLIYKLANIKYYSINCYHLIKGGGFTWKNNRKRTFEVRIGENNMCLSPYDVKNWIRFMMHFVKMTKNMPYPSVYKKGNQWTGLVWLDFDEIVNNVLRFNEPMSNGMNQVKDWFFSRMLTYGYDQKETPAIFSNKARCLTRESLMKYVGRKSSPWSYVDLREDKVFGEAYVI